MCQYVAIIGLVVLPFAASIPPPLRVTIDCGSAEDSSRGWTSPIEFLGSNTAFDINSFCNSIHRAIPQAVKDGKFVIESDSDQVGYSDTGAPVAVAPPRGFIPSGYPKLKPSRLRIPKLDVPKLKPLLHGLNAPKLGSPMSFTPLRYAKEEESSAERMERFKKGVQKMLHVVKVIGKIDQYLSERTRIVVDKLSKTFAD